MLFSLIYCFFLMRFLKFQKISHWNELSSIAWKWKFCRICWQWILIEQTFLYIVVYRTFLYNPTNLKVPKKAPCQTIPSYCLNASKNLVLTTVLWSLYQHSTTPSILPSGCSPKYSSERVRKVVGGAPCKKENILKVAIWPVIKLVVRNPY